ncbi:MAG: SMC-Scp complex subunit ScpB [Myxococcota bacterium]
MDREGQKRIVEALVLGAPEPVSAQKLAEVVPGLKADAARALVAELGREYDEQGRAFEIWEVAGGYQLRTRAEYASYLRLLHRERPLRLSRAALETLAVVAYRQPVTRAEIEAVRGVEVDAVVRGLLERNLVRIAGHREVPGRPMLYATTRRFLEVFGLSRIDDLPTLREMEELLAPTSEESGPPAPLAAEGDEAALDEDASETSAADAAADDAEPDDAEPEPAARLH